MDVENLKQLNQSYSSAAMPTRPKGAKSVFGDKTAEKATDGADIVEKEDEKFQAAVKDAVERANKELKTGGRRLSYSVHEKTHKVMVSVINTDTDEVIREIPPKSVLDSYAQMLEMAGLIVDERS